MNHIKWQPWIREPDEEIVLQGRLRVSGKRRKDARPNFHNLSRTKCVLSKMSTENWQIRKFAKAQAGSLTGQQKDFQRQRRNAKQTDLAFATLRCIVSIHHQPRLRSQIYPSPANASSPSPPRWYSQKNDLLLMRNIRESSGLKSSKWEWNLN